MEKTKINSHQLFSITANYTCGTSIIIVTSGLAGIAKQDAWMSGILTPIFGLLFIWIYSYLGSLYPDKSLIEMIRSVFGKWLGALISAAFVFLCLLDVPQITWYVSNFISSQYLSQTPTYVIHFTIIIVMMIALYYGLEAIARSSEIFVYLVSIMILLSLGLVSREANIDNLLPVLENGIAPVLKSSLLLSCYTTWPLIVIMMVYPSHAGNLKGARMSLFLGYLWGSIILFLCIIMTILVLGSTITARAQFPTYLLAREISVGALFTRMEAVIAGVWLVTLFYKMTFYFYGGVIGLSQLIGIKDYKKIILPMGFIILLLSDVVYPNGIYEAEWDTTTWVLFIVTFGVVLPITMLVVSWIKKWAVKKQ